MGVGGGALLSGWRGALVQGLDGRHATHRRQRPAADAGLSAVGAPARASPAASAPIYTGAPLYDAPDGPIPESGGVRRAAAGPVGKCGPQLDHRPGAVLAERVAWRARSAEASGSTLDLRVDATNVLNHVTFADVEHDRQQPAVRPADVGQRRCATCRPRLRVRF